MSSTPVKTKRTCSKHKQEPINIYSVTLKKCMCLKCAMIHHENLSDFIPVSEAIPMMKKENKHITDELSLLSNAAKTAKRDRTRFLENLRLGEKSIRGSVRKVRDKLNRQLDLMEQNVFKKVKQLIEKFEKSFVKDQRQTVIFETELKRMKDKLAIMIKTANDIDLIATVVEEKDNLEVCKQKMQQQQDAIPSDAIAFKLSPAIQDFLDNFHQLGEVTLNGDTVSDIHNNGVDPNHSGDESILTFGHRSRFDEFDSIPSSRRTVDAYATSPSHRFRDFQAFSPNMTSQRDSQLMPTRRFLPTQRNYDYGPGHTAPRLRHGMQRIDNPLSTRDIDNFEDADHERGTAARGIAESSVLSANHEGPCNLSGVAALSNGKVIVCDSKHKCIQLLNSRSVILDDLAFHYKPRDIDAISEKAVVVSFHDKDFVSIFSVSLDRLTRVKDINVSGRGGSYSIAYCRGRLAVCRRGEIKILSLEDGEIINSVEIESHFPQLTLSDGGKKIYLSDFVGGKVVCMNDLGKIRWEYGHDDLEPSNIALDLNQLFVADVKGKVLVLSTYGVLMRAITCPGQLHALCVDPRTGTVLVTEESKNRTQSRTIKILAI